MDLLSVDPILATAAVLICTFFVIYLTTRRQNGVPPGPALFPIFGNIPSLLTSDVLGKINELRKIYGDIFALYIGGRLTIFLNGFEAIDDAFKKQGSVFKRRPLSPIYLNNNGILFSNDEIWKEQRRFAQKAFHEIGFGANIKYLDEVINSEIGELVDKICTKDGAFDVEKYLNISISNIIFKLICNHRYDYDDLEIENMLKCLRDSANKFFIRDAILSCFPIMARFPKLGLMDTTFEYQLSFIAKFIANETEITKSADSTFADKFFEKIDENIPGELQNSFNIENLRITAYQLFTAGSETTAASVSWILLHLIRQPHIQDRVFAEIDETLGSECHSITDKKRLPYTHAVILEGLRIACVAPLGIPHSINKDVIFHGFLFPKNCTVIANLHSSLRDPRVWKEPEDFRPERFLSDDELRVVVPKEFIPFSLGPRSCLGESLAINEVFQYVTVLVRKFRLFPEIDTCLPETKGVLGVTFHPVPFKMRFLPR